MKSAKQDLFLGTKCLSDSMRVSLNAFPSQWFDAGERIVHSLLSTTQPGGAGVLLIQRKARFKDPLLRLPLYNAE